MKNSTTDGTVHGMGVEGHLPILNFIFVRVNRTPFRILKWFLLFFFFLSFLKS